MDLLALDLFELVHADCSMGGDFFDKLVLSTVVPLVVCALFVAARGGVVAWKGGPMLGPGTSGGLKYVLMVRLQPCMPTNAARPRPLARSRVVRRAVILVLTDPLPPATSQILFIIVPPTAMVPCSAYAVTELDNGDGTFDVFMTADMSIEAKGERYEALIALSTTMVRMGSMSFDTTVPPPTPPHPTPPHPTPSSSAPSTYAPTHYTFYLTSSPH